MWHLTDSDYDDDVDINIQKVISRRYIIQTAQCR